MGECVYSDITVFSFHPVKIITTGEGGVLTTRDPAIAQRLNDLRSHGITRERSRFEFSEQGEWYYEQQSLGFNYRMTEIQAALGVSQMKKLDSFIARRHRLSKRYDEALKDLPLVLPWQHPDGHSAFHLFVILVGDDSQINRSKLFELLRGAGILVNVHYIPIYLQPYYRRRGFDVGYLPITEQYYSRAISLPLHAGLSCTDQDYVIQKVRDFVL